MDEARIEREAERVAQAPTGNIIKYETEHGEVQLSANIVRQFLVSGQGNVTTEEITMFVKLCQFQKLNPFLREAYLIKYGNSQPAAIVTGKEVFTKRAAKNARFDGYEAGVTIKHEDGHLERREGALVFKGEELVAGWAKVYLKNARVPIFAEASFEEYAGRKSDGSLNKTWKGKPATMIRKVALVQALREAFPEDLGGMYDAAEMQMDSDELPTQPVETTATVVEPTTAPPAEDIVDAEYEVIPFGQDEQPAEEPVSAPSMSDLAASELPLNVLAGITMQDGNRKGCTLGELVKTDRQWVERYLEEGEDETVLAALRRLDNAYRAAEAEYECRRLAEEQATQGQ